MKCMKLLSKPGTDFWGPTKCTKLMMDEMYEISCKIRLASTNYCCTKSMYDLVVCVVCLLSSLNMNTAEFALRQLQEHKLCVTSKTHVDVVILVVQVVLYVWLFGMYDTSHAISHKFGLYVLSLQYE